MSHFTCYVVVPCDKSAIEVSEPEAEKMITPVLAPYDEGIEVEPYNTKCHCIGLLAQARAQALAEREVGAIDDIRMRFLERIQSGEVKEDDWTATIAPYQETKERAFSADPERNFPKPDCTECHGSGDIVSTYNPQSQWDWYVIGGRWNAIFTPSYKVEEDPRNYETCHLCDGTGKRDDAIGQQARIRDPAYTCNGCDGTGRRLKFPTFWMHPTGANIANPNAILAMLEAEQDLYPFAMVTQNEGWVEKAKMGWWGITSNKKELEVWHATVINLLTKYRDDHIVVNVDCHI